ncbi:MAG: polysaccharide biosynthesis/export family protein [Planctomycetia bacterium]|nr:polysaccharide biosynthesis/export family protein [Planctomycetia bacterium]
MLAGRLQRFALPTLWIVALAAATGCRAIVDRPEPRLVGPQTPPPIGEPVPTEKDKSTLPIYTIEPPDILLIDVLKVVPKPPYRIKATDVLSIEVEGTSDFAPIRDRFIVDSGGQVDLGPRYHKVHVAGLTIDEAVEAIRKFLLDIVRQPEVSVTLFQSAGLQPISGEHLVSPDGTVNLGTYGLVNVAGMTLDEAKLAVEEQLSKFLDRPQASLSVFSYNSKVYYVITEGAGSGDQVARLPITGNETVLDAIAQINGLSRLSSKHIWIARPTPGGSGCDAILPVSWTEITKGAATATNYQVLPGDRIFIAENKLIAFDAGLNHIIAPFERIMGFTLLSTQAVQTINRFPLGISGIGSGF